MDFSVFGIGLPEVFAILILLVVVVGPKRLPEMAYHIGRAVKTLQRYARAVRDVFCDVFQYLDEEIRTIKDLLAYSDGETTLLEIAELIGVPIWKLSGICRSLVGKDLIEVQR